jgi:hypothetical protein
MYRRVVLEEVATFLKNVLSPIKVWNKPQGSPNLYFLTENVSGLDVTVTSQYIGYCLVK